MIVAYPYRDAVDRCGTYEAFTAACQAIGLRITREDTVFRGHRAYRIIVADRDVDVEAAAMQLPTQL